MKHKKSFTLIEMLIVIVIIGILGASLIPRLQSIQVRARNAQRKVDVRMLGNGISIYYQDYNNYPVRLPHLVTGNVLTSLPVDPAVATNEVCGAYFSDFSAIYLASGFYSAANCVSNPVSCSTLHNGYLYAQSQSLDYATLGTRMEDDGTFNSYASVAPYSGIEYLCRREGDLGAYEVNQYNVRGRAIVDFQQGLDGKGKGYFDLYHKGQKIY